MILFFILIEETNNSKYGIKIRIPYWLKKDIKVKINGNLVEFKKEKGYISISKLWKKGDVLEINLDMNLHIYKSTEDENKICFMYGPLVLAGSFGKENFPESDIIEDHLKLNHYKAIEVPILISEDNNLLKNINKIETNNLEFELNFNNENKDFKVKLIPFYDIHHERYAIYFNSMTKNEYKNREFLNGKEKIKITIKAKENLSTGKRFSSRLTNKKIG